MPATEDGVSATRRSQVASVLLACASGSFDALAFLALGQVFASVMTGNLVLLGIALQRTDAAQALASGVALGGYAAGVLASSPVAHREPRERWASRLEIALVVLFVIGWEVAAGAAGSDLDQNLLLLLAASAMGVQSIVSARLPGGPSTTYFTSTLTGVIAELARHRGLRAWSAARLAALVAGAVLAALLLQQAPRYAAVPPLLAVLLARGTLRQGADRRPAKTS